VERVGGKVDTKNWRPTGRAAMVKVVNSPSCSVCKKGADSLGVGLRRGMCRACYLRHWRGTALPDGAACVICQERRRIVLRWTKVGAKRVVTCQNCGFVADKARPRPASAAELVALLNRERRGARERRRNYVIEPADPAERRQALRRAGRRLRG
jgi:NMD protein affecting ribosome stability and mRNA decay